ncbi:MAG TPA: hypothetical protein VFO39_06975 [Candidatus Sulfotelmatobacter sp.]|nr:hypothetical protein [Candidatus Sulfotelmatobacter sp.]
MSPRSYALFAVLLAVFCLTPTAHAQTQAAKVDITFNGKVVTGQTQTIMSGQLVQLGYSVSGGPSAVSVAWLVPQYAVGGFPASVQKTQVIPLTINQEPRFYWIDQGLRKQITLEYILSDREEGRVFTWFNVMGPTNVNVTAQTQAVEIFGGGTQVGLGQGTPESQGIVFNVTATMPSGGSGHFIWVQYINSDDFGYSGPGVVCTMASAGGLDVPKQTPNSYQYGTGPGPIDDSPDEALGSSLYNQVSRQLIATMYLLWKYDGDQTSIPVPLGLVNWQTGWDLSFAKSAKCIAAPCWNVTSSQVWHSVYQPYIHYPGWNGVSTIKQVLLPNVPAANQKCPPAP